VRIYTEYVVQRSICEPVSQLRTTTSLQPRLQTWSHVRKKQLYALTKKKTNPLYPNALLCIYCTPRTSATIMDPPSPRTNPSTGRFSRAATFSEGLDQRRNSTLSDSLSEARNSIRSSTDDLFLPRVSKAHTLEESHWHSTPLGLALLPAIAGIFFQNGSAFVTDVTLLVLAAIFLNWSVRLPWYIFPPPIYQ
jgi:hypothetical protein